MKYAFPFLPMAMLFYDEQICFLFFHGGEEQGVFAPVDVADENAYVKLIWKTSIETT
jgi:hypothetical protein